MRLREFTVFMKLSTHVDILHDATYIELARSLESFTGERFATFRDLVPPRARERAIADLGDPRLHELSGLGTNLRARFRLDGLGERGYLEVNATTHPYSGVYHTQVDARIDRAHLATRSAREAYVAFMRRWVERLSPVCAHAHDTDDHAIQNTDNAGMLRLGYGVDVREVRIEDNPGREVNRGERRYCATWLTYVGAEMCEKLVLAGAELDVQGLAMAEQLQGGWWYRLYEDGLSPEAEHARATQQLLRDALQFDALAARERWTLGYWQRK